MESAHAALPAWLVSLSTLNQQRSVDGAAFIRMTGVWRSSLCSIIIWQLSYPVRELVVWSWRDDGWKRLACHGKELGCCASEKITGTESPGGRKQNYIAHFPLEKIVPEDANRQIFTSGNAVGPLLKIFSLFELIMNTRCTAGTWQMSNNNNSSGWGTWHLQQAASDSLLGETSHPKVMLSLGDDHNCTLRWAAACLSSFFTPLVQMVSAKTVETDRNTSAIPPFRSANPAIRSILNKCCGFSKRKGCESSV